MGVQADQDYGKAVAGEWDTMTVAASGEAEVALRGIYAALIKGFSEGEQNRLMQQRLLADADDLSEARQQRLSMAQNVVSLGQWVLVIGLGLLLLTVAAGLHARQPERGRWRFPPSRLPSPSPSS